MLMPSCLDPVYCGRHITVIDFLINTRSGGSMNEELRIAIDNLQRAFQKSGLKGMRIGFGPDGTIIETFAANGGKRDTPWCLPTPSSPSGTDGATDVRDIAKRLTDRRDCGHDPWQRTIEPFDATGQYPHAESRPAKGTAQRGRPRPGRHAERSASSGQGPFRLCAARDYPWRAVPLRWLSTAGTMRFGNQPHRRGLCTGAVRLTGLFPV